MYLSYPKKKLIRLALPVLFACFLILNLNIASDCVEEDDESPVKAFLISEVKSIRPGRSFWTALRLQMDEHWHTYWKNPGDAGLPTTISWKLPEGFAAGEIQWPYPKRIEEPPLVTFGYEDEVLLLVEIQPPQTLNPGMNVKLGATAEWLMCKESCIPGSAELLLELPVIKKNPEIDKSRAELFKKARTRLSKLIPGWKVKAFIDDVNIVIQILPPTHYTGELEDILFLPALPGLVEYAEDTAFKKTENGYYLTILRSQFIKTIPERLQGVLYLEAGWDADKMQRALAVDVPLHIKQ